jgi:hypothetical protein
VQQTGRTSGNLSELLRLPDLWEGKNIHEVTEAVHNDYSEASQVELIQWIWQEGTQLDYDIVVPFWSYFDFVGLMIGLNLNTWDIGFPVAPTTFTSSGMRVVLVPKKWPTRSWHISGHHCRRY